MADYTTQDTSVQDGSPIHLFQFLLDGMYYRYTNRPEGITAMGYSWEYSNLDMGEVEVDEDINRNDIPLKLPRDNQLAEIFFTDIQDSVCGVTIFRGYEDALSDFITYWKGRVASFNIMKNTVDLKCESIFTSMKRPGLGEKMSKNCPHVLYGRGCNLDATDSATDALYIEDIVSDISSDGLTLTIASAGLQADGYYRGGMVQAPDGVFRYIRDHVGEQVTLSIIHDGFVSSDYVRLFPGCDRTTTTCSTVFNNLDNHGGAPYTNINPFNGKRL